jgi:aminoglycoside phosphotransferase
MTNNKFVYFPPGRKEYFFSANLMEKRRSVDFLYSPFSLATKLFWNLILNSILFRSFFTCEEKSMPSSIQKILKLLDSNNAAFQIKMGTEGPDQKTTLIKHSKKDITFFKIGNTKRGIELINNEYAILNELNGKFNAPKVKKFYSKEGFQFLETDYIIAQKIKSTTINESIFLYLLTIASQNIDSNESITTSFNHGDCCPWNLLQQGESNVLLIDWELAGKYALGYDLFTFIFQTAFLLTPNISNREILEDNMVWIQRFFDNFDIEDIKQYLSCFVIAKLEDEKRKGKVSKLTKKYLQLHQDLPNLQL